MARASERQQAVKSLRRCWDFGRQAMPWISRAVEVTQSLLQKSLWPGGWWGLKTCEPTSGLLLLPPSAGPPTSPVGALSSVQHPHLYTLITTITRVLTLSPCAHPCLIMGWPFTMYLLSTNPSQLQIFLSIALFFLKHGSVPTNKSTRVVHRLGLTWWVVIRVSCILFEATDWTRAS